MQQPRRGAGRVLARALPPPLLRPNSLARGRAASAGYQQAQEKEEDIMDMIEREADGSDSLEVP